jgi:hypothetical protein
VFGGERAEAAKDTPEKPRSLYGIPAEIMDNPFAGTSNAIPRDTIAFIAKRDPQW